MNSIIRIAFAAAVAMLATQPASAATFQCDELEKIVAAADKNFAGLGGAVSERETAADLAARLGVSVQDLGLDANYERLTRPAKRKLTGAESCEIHDAKMIDEDADITQSVFVCLYPKQRSITDALRDELEACLQQSIDPDSDESALMILLDHVETDEGYAGTSVEAQVDEDEGLSLSVSRSICRSRAPKGCDDSD